MKLTAIFLLIGFLQVSARTTAQQRISITIKGATLEKVFTEIEKRSGFTVFYDAEVLRTAGTVSIDMKDAGIEAVMQRCLKGLPLEFTVQEKTVLVIKEAKKISAEYSVRAADPAVKRVGGAGRSEEWPLITVSIHAAWLHAAIKAVNNQLDETLVKGYYNTTNQLNTGDVTTVKREDIQKQLVSDPIFALEGEV